MLLDISTPALVFPALSVLMLAYTNKFIAISKRVRALHAEHKRTPTQALHKQIRSLNKRMIYIRNMQICAIAGFSSNILSMGFIFLGLNTLAIFLFGLGISLVFISLIISILEIYMSVQAMTVLLNEDLQGHHDPEED